MKRSRDAVAGGRTLPWALALASPPAVLGGPAALATLSLDALALGGAFLEGRRAIRLAPTVTREIPPHLVVGQPAEIVIRLDNPHDVALRGELVDTPPPTFAADGPSLPFSLAPGGRAVLRYPIVPAQRGRFEFGSLVVRLRGRLGLGDGLVEYDGAVPVAVYPNVFGSSRRELRMRVALLRDQGAKRIRRAGGGADLDQLREYVPGDALRAIDWNASAKRLRPITRLFEQERSQNILLAIDTGRWMAARLHERPYEPQTKLDHAIDAALLLAHVALGFGDRVGLVTFSSTVHDFIPPERGLSHYRTMLGRLYDATARPSHVDVRGFAEFVKRRVPRRALVVVFSDLLDESQAAPLADGLLALRGRHLPICVTLRDVLAESLAEEKVADPHAVFARAAAVDLLAERRAVLARLAKEGVPIVEADEGELAIRTVERYIDVKSRQLL